MSYNQTIDRLHIDLTWIFQDTLDYVERYNNAPPITWSWIATRTAQLMMTYPTGLTNAIVLAELESMWEQRCIMVTSHKFDTIANKYDPELAGDTQYLDCRITQLQYKHDTILRLATLKDSSKREMDMYLPLKCNAWLSDNTISPYLKDFSKDRRLRFRCPPQINSLLVKQYHNMTLPRSDRVVCCPPTHDCLWQLQVEDAAWIKDVFFKDTFATVITPHSMAAAAAAGPDGVPKKHQLWVKVVHVEQDETELDEQEPMAAAVARKSTGSYQHQQQQRLTRKDVYVVDKSNDTDPAILSFYDQQTDLTRLIQRGDYLGLYDPVVVAQLTASQVAQTDLVFECGPNTMLFIMTNDDAIQAGVTKVDPSSEQSSMLSSLAVAQEEEEEEEDDSQQQQGGQHSPMRDFFQQRKRLSKRREPIMERDDEGLMDCLAYVPRIKISDLEPSMLNITLSGRVVAKAKNNPFLGEDGKRMDRYAIRIEDETGKVDVTLWEHAGQYAKKILVGERLVLTGLSTSVQHKSIKGKRAWYVNGSAVCGTVIYNVSQFECLLVSSGFGSLTPLYSIQGDGQWETEATIVGWKLHGMDPTQPAIYANDHDNGDRDDDAFCISDYIVVQAHRDCLEIVQESSRCDYCDKEIIDSDKSWVFRQRKQVSESESMIGWIEWRLDDGHGTLDTYGAEKTIMGCLSEQFKTMSPGLQIGLLDSVVGTQWTCSISCVGSLGYRLDRVVAARQYQNRCISLVNSMSDLL